MEATRVASETERQRQIVNARLNRMPENERRSNSGALNVVTGEIVHESGATAQNDFPLSHVGRATRGREQQTAIVTDRDRLERRDQSRVACRYSNGRERELRDWNIVNGTSMRASLDASVVPRPSVWEWCSTERLRAGSDSP
jgi:hypothetical protein